MRYKSNLFIPGHTLNRLDRGLNSNASALIIDLEDGCPEDKKIKAREELIGLLKKGNVFTKPLFVRVNDAMNENGRQDIDALSDFEDQIEAMRWLVDIVKEYAKIPVSIDSSNPEIIKAGLDQYDNHMRPMVNSLSLERKDLVEAIEKAERRIKREKKEKEKQRKLEQS